jgi:hypothetical protein
MWLGIGLFAVGVFSAGIGAYLLVQLRRRQQPVNWIAQQAFMTRVSHRAMTEATPAHPGWLGGDTQANAQVGVVARAFLVGHTGEHYPLYEGENTIGRHGSNMIQIMDATASRYHAVIEIHGDEFEYMDWQASQPSDLNGQFLERGRRYPLRHGDRIRIGVTVLRFVVNR